MIVASAEEAADGNAELWLGGELMAVTVLYDGRLHLRIDPRRDGEPWMIDTTSLGLALDDAVRQIAKY
ncbi:MAG TPA: hypothetical protein VFG79_08920 [Solirubrobacter sp.]|nr:hypothetical protein [Solirubrobacter sp.]